MVTTIASDNGHRPEQRQSVACVALAATLREQPRKQALIAIVNAHEQTLFRFFRLGGRPAGRRRTTHAYLERVCCLVALTSDNAHAVDERYDFGWILLLEFDLRVEHFEPLDAGLAAIVQHQVLAHPAFLHDFVLLISIALHVQETELYILPQRKLTLKKPPGVCSDKLPHLTMRCVSSILSMLLLLFLMFD